MKNLTSPLETQFELWIKVFHLPKPTKQYRFLPPRRWKFDFAWIDKKVAVEIEGGIWIYGRHNRAKTFILDCEKYNEAVFQGWKVFRFTEEMLTKDTLQRLKSVVS